MDKPTETIKIGKTIQARENSIMSKMIHTSHTHPGPRITVATSTTSCSTVSINFMQRPNTEMETSEHKALNYTLVLRNEVLNSTWKLSANHAPPPTYIKQKYIRIRELFYLRDRNRKDTRKTLGTLSWVYKPSNYYGDWRWQSLLVILVARPASS